MITELKIINDVSVFFLGLLHEGINAHPDVDFFDYINIETQKPTFTLEEAVLRNNLMSKAFEICEVVGIDVYDLMQEIYLKGTGLDRFIPLPSQEPFE